MKLNPDLLLTALAPIIWGSSYVITTELLPHGAPLSVAMARALPAGLILLAITRQLPQGNWWPRVALLGFLNFTLFWGLMFVAAYRLPGGIAATVGALQPLIVIFLARLILGRPLRRNAIFAALLGFAGVAALVLSPKAALDPIGLLAGLGAAASMASGMVLSRHWSPPVSTLTFTAWQLCAGGIFLIPLVMIFEPNFMPLDQNALLGLAYLSLIGGAFTYVIFLRGVAKFEPSALAALGFFSPLTAVILGWIVLDQSLSPVQIFGAATVLLGVWLAQRA